MAIRGRSAWFCLQVRSGPCDTNLGTQVLHVPRQTVPLAADPANRPGPGDEASHNIIYSRAESGKQQILITNHAQGPGPIIGTKQERQQLEANLIS